MKKYFLLSMICIFCISAIYSQDLITTKSGEDILAKVLEISQNEIKFKRFDNVEGPVFILNKSDIIIIRYENGTKDIFSVETEDDKKPSDVFKSIQSQINEDYSFNSGYRLIAETGYCIGVGDFNLHRFKLDFVNGYQLNTHFFIGLGTGLRFYSEQNNVYMPIYAEARGNLFTGEISPYASIGIGYSVDISESGGGFYMSPKVGADFKLSKKLWLIVGLGYELQKAELVYSRYGNIYFSSENLGAFCINLGLSL